MYKIDNISIPAKVFLSRLPLSPAGAWRIFAYARARALATVRGALPWTFPAAGCAQTGWMQESLAKRFFCKGFFVVFRGERGFVIFDPFGLRYILFSEV